MSDLRERGWWFDSWAGRIRYADRLDINDHEVISLLNAYNVVPVDPKNTGDGLSPEAPRTTPERT